MDTTESTLTDAIGDLDLDRDLQKFHKQCNLISTCPSQQPLRPCPKAFMPLARQCYHIHTQQRTNENKHL